MFLRQQQLRALRHRPCLGYLALLSLLTLQGLFLSPVAAAQAPRKIFIAVDGFSHNAFVEAQRQGLFLEFNNSGTHIAPFPSMTDLSWATMMNTADLFGSAGRIKNVEATYFDESTQSIQGDPRDYYQRLAFPKYFLGAFDAIFNPYVEALVYFPTEEVPKLEIKSVIDQILASKGNGNISAYIGSVDSTAHTQPDRLYPVLKVLDHELKRLQKSFKEQNTAVEVIMVSDHGNVGRFREGGKERELVGVEIKKLIEEAGFNFVATLERPKDIAMPLLALGSWGPVYFKNRENRQPLIERLRTENWFDLALYVNKNNRRETLMTVISTSGEAIVRLDKDNSEYTYTPINGNPLQLPARFHSKPMSAAESTTASAGSAYPDAVFRVMESASDRNFDYPDLIITLKDGYFLQNALGGFTKMYRTHGALSRASSSGLIASTIRIVPNEIRTQDILPFLKMDARVLFGDTYKTFAASAKEGLSAISKTHARGVETRAWDLSEPRLFRHLSRFVSDTRPYFLVSEMKSFMEAFQNNPLARPREGMASSNFDISKFNFTGLLSADDIGAITDVVLTAGSVEKFMEDPRIQDIKDRFASIHETKASAIQVSFKNRTEPSLFDQISHYFLPAKRSIMKTYQIPYLLQNSLVIQEKTFLPDLRDLRFANAWVRSKADLNSSYENLMHQPDTDDSTPYPQRLFREVRKEIELEDKVYPTPISRIYNGRMDGVTIVYVPGIYDAIFDKEIFSLGIQALKDEFGLRVIQPPVESSCSADVNGEIILKYIHKDMENRVERNHTPPRYLFVSYSKGAVDTLHFFTKYPGFVSTHVLGMVSIAAPLRGASILNKSSLPFEIVAALSEKSTPKICQTDKTAAKSITPAAMDSFWRKNERMLTGLTRYYSVSFESSPEDSHLFMRATKLISQFDEDNDGVVTVSSSKFPEKLKAVDLGMIHADHLAGILSSTFNQKSFMKSLVTAVRELNGHDWKNNFSWNSNIIVAASNQGRRFWQLRSTENQPYSNSWDLNRMLLPAISDPADDFISKMQLPPSQLRFDPYATLDIQKMPDILAMTSISPATRQNLPSGILIDYHHQNMVHFRLDHRFNYESRSPVGLDDNREFGFAPAIFKGEKDWLMMKSKNNSMRMTTMAYRFSPVEFPNMNLKLAVTQDVTGADPVKGKTGKDDSAFQVWFSIRVGNATGTRTHFDPKNDRVILFGYYWANAVPGETRKAGDIFENWYSDKNIIVATLPHAKQLLLNSPDSLGRAETYSRNFKEDLQRAFPDIRVDEMEILSITLQHDSNDTGSSSEAYFKHLRFTP